MLSRRALIAALALSPVTLLAGELTAHDFAFPGIEGGLVRLADYAGQPILVVNTASRCGFTYQYDGLQSLYERYHDRGLVIVGVPSDDFNQELSDEAAVKAFCEANFAIQFPMTAISSVTGTGAHPFYAWARREVGPGGAPRWNFHKYLIGPEGRLAGSFGTHVEPTGREITTMVESLLPQG
ncbi:MAG: glutathione peroxidase [Pseudomonadota bacterium]